MLSALLNDSLIAAFLLPILVAVLFIPMIMALSGKKALLNAMRLKGWEAVVVLALGCLFPPLFFIEQIFYLPIIEDDK